MISAIHPQILPSFFLLVECWKTPPTAFQPGDPGGFVDPRWRSSDFAVAELVEVACALANGGVWAAQWGHRRLGRWAAPWAATEPRYLHHGYKTRMAALFLRVLDVPILGNLHVG